MKFYCNHYQTEGSVCQWFTSKRDAQQAAAAHARENPQEEKPETHAVDIEPTKAGILEALNRWAGQVESADRSTQVAVAQPQDGNQPAE